MNTVSAERSIGFKLVERLGVGVLADAGVHAVFPAVDPADQIVPFDLAVRHQRAAVETTAVQHRDRLSTARDSLTFSDGSVAARRERTC